MSLIKIKQLIDEDFVNYKAPSMFIGFPNCTFKCGTDLCQNSALAKATSIEVDTDELAYRYKENPISEAIVVGGLEPFDDFQCLVDLIKDFRKVTQDTFVVYTGFTEEEISEKLNKLKAMTTNIVVKVGRYIPGEAEHLDDVLGVKLASNNQYAFKLC